MRAAAQRSTPVLLGQVFGQQVGQHVPARVRGVLIWWDISAYQVGEGSLILLQQLGLFTQTHGDLVQVVLQQAEAALAVVAHVQGIIASARSGAGRTDSPATWAEMER